MVRHQRGVSLAWLGWRRLTLIRRAEAAREQVDAEGLDEWDIAARTIEQFEQLLAADNGS